MKFIWKSNWTVSFIETSQLSKSERKSEYNSSCLHSDSSKINTEKSQGNESVLVAQLIKNFLL